MTPGNLKIGEYRVTAEGGNDGRKQFTCQNGMTADDLLSAICLGCDGKVYKVLRRQSPYNILCR